LVNWLPKIGELNPKPWGHPEDCLGTSPHGFGSPEPQKNNENPNLIWESILQNKSRVWELENYKYPGRIWFRVLLILSTAERKEGSSPLSRV
jgi:hypothetical protein